MSNFQRRIKGAKDHTPGKVRYFTYYLEFPDKETWVDQIPFVHPLEWELKQTRWYKYDPNVYRDLLVKGEASFHDHNGVRHIIKVEEEKRAKKWGTKAGGGAHKFMVS